MTWAALAEALERADGPSRELDREMICMNQPGLRDFLTKHPDGYLTPYTVSLDAIVALIGEKLPGWRWEWVDDTAHVLRSVNPGNDIQRYSSEDNHDDDQPALALCAAFCRVKAAVEAPVSGREEG